jgi:uncharacterized protein (DUF433 family)
MALLEELAPHPPPLRTEEGGVVRVGQTRVSLDTVIATFHQGCSPEEIVLKFPTLDLTDVYAVVTYYLWNREEVEAYLERRRLEAAALRTQMEERFPAGGVRERLLARRAANL